MYVPWFPGGPPRGFPHERRRTHSVDLYRHCLFVVPVQNVAYLAVAAPGPGVGAGTDGAAGVALALPGGSARVADDLRVPLVPRGAALTPPTRELRGTVPTRHLPVHLHVTVTCEPGNQSEHININQ